MAQAQGHVPGAHALRLARAAGWVLVLECLLLGVVLLLQPTFTTPSVVVISPQATWAGYVANRINTEPGHPVRAFVGTSEPEAMADLLADRTQAVLLIDPAAAADRLTTSTAQGSAAAATIRAVTESVQHSAGREVETTDATATVAGDPAGRHGYHLAITWLVCGLAFALAAGGVGRGSAGAQLRLLPLVLAAAAAVSAVSVGVVCLAVPTWTSRAPALFVLGTLSVTMVVMLARAAAAVGGTAGLVAGVAAMALIAANPGASGAEGFGRADVLWQPIGPWTPPGLVVGGIRRLVYLDRAVSGMQWGGLLWWLMAGLLLAVVATARRPGTASGAGE